LANLFFLERKMRSAAKRVEHSSGYWYQSKMEWFSLRPNTSMLSKSEPAYPHSILMQEPKDTREKSIEAKIYRAVKVTNNGWCVVDHDI
jgi:hypothetical protein